MERQSAVADELAVKVNYIRDWLNKAEDAIRRGDKIEAIAKLSLAKADTTYLISNLIPQPKEMQNAHRVPRHAFAWHKLAMLAAPFALIGCFLLGLSVGGPNIADYTAPALNPPINIHTDRYAVRPAFNDEFLALIPNTRGQLDQPVSSNAISSQVPAKRHNSTVSRTVHAEIPETTAAIADTTAEAVPGETAASSATEEPLNLFDFGLNVIRSARQNMAR
jgi:hypothetical protein